MAAGLDGIARRLDRGSEAEDRSGSCSGFKETFSEARQLPETLGEAVSCMEQNSFVKHILGEDFVRWYTEAKRAEWNEYMSQVSEWEIEKYLYRM